MKPVISAMQESSKPTFCRVCSGIVPKRQFYQPRVCEACQKFFRHNYGRTDVPSCQASLETGQRCIISRDTRRQCRRCRLDRCLEIGMTIRPRKSNHNEDDLIDSSFPLESIFREPMLSEAEAIEDTFRNVSRAFTHLHAFEFLPLKRPPRVAPGTLNQSLLSRLGYAQHEAAIRVGFEYCKAFEEYTGLPSGIFHQKVSLQFLAIALELQQLASTAPENQPFFGISPFLRQVFLKNYPIGQVLLDAHDELRQAVAEWSPSFLEVALLVAISLLNSDKETAAHPKLSRLRHRMMRSLSIHQSKLADGCDMLIDTRRSHFDRVMMLSQRAADAYMNYMVLRAHQHASPSLSLVLKLRDAGPISMAHENFRASHCKRLGDSALDNT